MHVRCRCYIIPLLASLPGIHPRTDTSTNVLFGLNLSPPRHGTQTPPLRYSYIVHYTRRKSANSSYPARTLNYSDGCPNLVQLPSRGSGSTPPPRLPHASLRYSRHTSALTYKGLLQSFKGT
ncbi:hypothetical protein E2C01_074876 [Portunus trituberculatus]|uniref:Uncharacterized protein n=1 Tax=Portunus trituberculatus TaxID=210409 RepID=A0A5B7IEN9_PORTR|nr:hypothetical protein [Portunus trituberculatus]